MSTDHDQAYIQKVLEGDTKAFSILVDRYKDMVFTLALRMMKNREEAEEMAQDVFMKVFKYLGGFKKESKFSTWIYRVTYNTGLDRLKGKKEVHLSIDDFEGEHATDLNNALEALEYQERQKLIQECLQLLAPEDSFILTLYYFKELKIEEITKVVKMNSNTLKVKLHRSRKKLAVILKQKMTPEEIELYEKDGKR